MQSMTPRAINDENVVEEYSDGKENTKGAMKYNVLWWRGSVGGFAGRPRQQDRLRLQKDSAEKAVACGLRIASLATLDNSLCMYHHPCLN